MKKKNAAKYIVFGLIMVFSLFLFGCVEEIDLIFEKDGAKGNGKLQVHFIDVGQGDSILVQYENNYMLIDGGPNASADKVLSYLKKTGVEKIDYLIATHPHEDHIGGIDVVIDNYDIGKMYMPKATANTKTFKDVVASMKKKNLKATAPKPGETFKLGDAEVLLLAPNSSTYENTNNYSIALKVTYGDNSFLFTGDAETLAEKEIIKNGFDIKADVIKLGHHGSKTSSSAAFLKEVNPEYGVITLGKGNDYGHPHKEVMDRVEKMGIKIYRVDEAGDIIATSDGKNIKFNVVEGSYKTGKK
ncbi:ComEC/Rec2 family competence protein [uncultured Clostridium sp.]|uniref:ComEC/Rec2 family competence protein n=1 Tax=uncultured Clostridium sp. TaxID=59620 RepID=UPI0028ED12C1|nr:ComEC/Rec2 family competence protein [uncultured Clostridium sp.]